MSKYRDNYIQLWFVEASHGGATSLVSDWFWQGCNVILANKIQGNSIQVLLWKTLLEIKKWNIQWNTPFPLTVALSDYCDPDWDNCIEFLKDQWHVECGRVGS